MTRHLFVLLVALCLSASPASAMPTLELHNIDTTAAFGTFTPPAGFGMPADIVRVGTHLSSDVDQSSMGGPSLSLGTAELLKANALVPPEFGDLFISEFGLLDNLSFLTGSLPDLGPANDNLIAALDQLLTDLQTANPMVTFTATLTPTGDQFLDRITLTPAPTAIETAPNPDVLHIGQVDIDLFRIDMTVTATQTPGPGAAVPEPASAVLGVLGLAALLRRRARHGSVSSEGRRID